MTKYIFKLYIALALIACCFAAESRAQNADIAARETEWQNYKLPSSDFARYTDAKKVMVFRVPVEWKQRGSGLIFSGADNVELRVGIDEIPEGISLRGYVASLLQGIRKFSTDSDEIAVRRTQMSGIEAREVMFEMAGAHGEMLQAIVWTVVEGPRAVSFMLVSPPDQVSAAEPYFKAVVQSAIIFGDMTKLDQLRAAALKVDKPGRIDEALLLAPALDGVDAGARHKAVSSLAKLFVESPDAVVDLIEDPRPMIRAAAAEAIGLSGNLNLKDFLFEAFDDPDAFVVERAAKALLALKIDLASWIRSQSSLWNSFNFQKTLRVASLVDQKARIEIIAELFKPFKPVKLTTPPPLPRKSLQPRVAAKKSKSPVLGLAPPVIAPPPELGISTNRQLLAILLLGGIPVADFKMPIDDIIASRRDDEIVAALRVALARRERLPAEPLFKLLDSTAVGLQGLAAINLADSAASADIARIEARERKASSISQSRTRGVENLLVEELRATIKKIRVREQLAAATGDARRQIIKQALEDKQLADWVWIRFARDEFETPNDNAATDSQSANQQNTKRVEIAPLGENLFPANITLYAALPDPASAFNKLGDALAGIQMETARSQADLTLMTSFFKAQIAQFLGVPPDNSTLDYLGIKMNAPLAFASWTAETAPRGISAATRKAILLRVSDRERFERVLTLYQKHLGRFENLTSYVSTGARVIGLVPAFLPYVAYTSLKDENAAPKAKTKAPVSLSFSFIGRDQCLGYPVKIIHRLELKKGITTGDPIYLVYVGEAALLAPDLYSLRDALARLSNNRSLLADNPDFKRVVAQGGDVIYMSNPFDLMALSSQKSYGEKLTESGALKISNQSWENSYNLSFKESAWARLFKPFQPVALSAPRDLLPRSTLAYFFIQLDVKGAIQEWANELFSADETKAFVSAWAMDFEKDVLPELGPECGAALLGFPETEGEESNLPGIIYFKLKSDKLARAFAEGRLLKESASTGRPSRIRFGSSEMFMTIRNGFLILAGNEAAFERLNSKDKLDQTRDFARTAKRAPDGIIAFGGYNPEAAIAEVLSLPKNPDTSQAVSVLTSLARAFHSQSIYVTATADSLSAQMSVSLDREGRYSVAELSSLAKDYRLALAMIEPRGVPITNQRMIETLKLKIRAKASGEIDVIKEDLSVENQNVEKPNREEMILSLHPRRPSPVGKVELPISNAELAPYLKPTSLIRSDDKSVIEKAREIAGQDRDAWSVARKLSDWTYKNLRWKRVDNADAADTLATREADCLEFSQLFVAMARSLGLPARIVSGMAYGDGSFGGHAWVEVYAGRWIELDPTWGTDFVDATHVRSASGELLAHASLNLVSIEVMEAVRDVADYQRDAQLMSEKICEEIKVGIQTALTTAIDMQAMTDEHIGEGTWSKLSDHEREQLMSSGPKLATHLGRALARIGVKPRVLKVSKTADRAEATVIMNDYFGGDILKIELARKGDTWLLMDIIDTETDFHIANERMRSMFRGLVASRDGKQKFRSGYSDMERTRMMLASGDSKGALIVVEQLLKQEPNSRRLRYMRAVCMARADLSDTNNEAIKLWAQLGNEDPPMFAALYALAFHYSTSEEAADKKKAVELYSRCVALDANDPRPHRMLAGLYKDANELARAENEYRAAIERDPRCQDYRISLARMLVELKRYDDALVVLDESARDIPPEEDLLGLLLMPLLAEDSGQLAEGFAAAHPERLTKSAEANLILAQIRIVNGRAKDALPLLKRATELKKNYSEAHISTAEAYRKLRNWTAALAAANAALDIDSDNGEAHYNMACALAQMNRRADAIIALKRAIELDEYLADDISDEEDLKPLSRMPAFIKLLPKDEDEEK